MNKPIVYPLELVLELFNIVQDDGQSYEAQIIEVIKYQQGQFPG